MIEIGPNLKEVLIYYLEKCNLGDCPKMFKFIEKYIRKNAILDKHKGDTQMVEIGPMLEEYFGELIKQAVKNEIETIDETRSDTIKTEPNNTRPLMCPTKSGYYWFETCSGHKTIVYYCKEYDYYTFIGDHVQYKINKMVLFHGYFVEPIEPIPEPGKCYIK